MTPKQTGLITDWAAKPRPAAGFAMPFERTEPSASSEDAVQLASGINGTPPQITSASAPATQITPNLGGSFTRSALSTLNIQTLQ